MSGDEKITLEKKKWWGYAHHDVKELLSQSLFLLRFMEKREASNVAENPSTRSDRSGLAVRKFHDYSFIVFPAAKAYEGFLKTVFLDLNFITEKKYLGKRFRVGKALNPALKGSLRRKEGVYDAIVDYCGGDGMAKIMWDTWKTCRNLLFHWFPNEKNAIDLKEARARVETVVETMDMVYGGCRLE